MQIVLTIFGAIGLLLLWYFSTLSKSTYYRAVQPNDTVTTQDGREARKKDLISKITRGSLLYIIACVSVTSLVWVIPKISTVRAALNPTATATITLTPTVTVTRTPTPTRMTSTPRSMFPTGSPTVSVSPTERVTATPKIIYQNVPVIQTRLMPVVQTVIATRLVPVTVVVYQTMIVPATVIVYQTVIVIASPTWTPTWTPVITDTPTGTATATFTPTETPTP